ncbi:MAG: alpha/beta fold hydrolase [Paracoccaceae bacterium]|nr:alpha/beta fold hydrolase [Paracoccaceae bacterium]
MALIWAGLALAALAALPFLAEALRQPAHRRRAEAPGRFADLPSGWTHYRWDGPADGAPVVLIHGLTTPAFVWEGLAPLLAAKGYRVLSYDLFSRGFSEAAPGRQDRGFFLHQLEELLEHESLDGPLTLVGYSMGGEIAAAFAVRHPGRIERLVLIAPAGLGHELRPIEAFVQSTPVLGDWIMWLFGGRKLRNDIRPLVGGPTTVPGIFERQLRETHARGFLPAVLSSQRHMLAEDQSDDHRRLAAAGIPVTAIWGDEDDAIPLSAKDRLAALNPAARQIVVKGATHGLPHTHPETVAAAL